MARAYRMTARRRVALRKAQLASARKRRRAPKQNFRRAYVAGFALGKSKRLNRRAHLTPKGYTKPGKHKKRSAAGAAAGAFTNIVAAGFVVGSAATLYDHHSRMNQAKKVMGGTHLRSGINHRQAMKTAKKRRKAGY